MTNTEQDIERDNGQDAPVVAPAHEWPDATPGDPGAADFSEPVDPDPAPDDDEDMVGEYDGDDENPEEQR